MILFSQCLGLIAVLAVALVLTGAAAVRTGKRWLRPVIALLVLALLFVLYFFRNPPRSVPSLPESVLSPADGTVADTAAVLIAPDGGGSRTGLALYLSLFNVHVNRIPVSGVIVSREFTRGRFLPAFSRNASAENEHLLLGIATERGICYVKQIAGFLARTVVCHAEVGDTVYAGEPYGMIKFGSRVEIFPPGNPALRVSPGTRVAAGTTEIFRYEHE